MTENSFCLNFNILEKKIHCDCIFEVGMSVLKYNL